MSNTINSSSIVYEQPLNERMRTFLRYEQLTSRFKFYAQQQDSNYTHTAMMTLIEITGLVSRGDIKQELLKEIKRQIDHLESLSNKPNLNTSILEKILSNLKSIFDKLHTTHGQLGSHLKNNDFIGSLRQRAAIPGGTCDFDLPEYHYWLAKPASVRTEALMEWISPFDIVLEGIKETLHLIRESTPSELKSAQKGFYDQNLDHSQPNQLIRIRLDRQINLFPECSAGKHRFSIRFLEQNNPNNSPKQTQSNIEFE